MSDTYRHGVLQARLVSPSLPPWPAGERFLEIPAQRPGSIVYIPANWRTDRPAPLLLLLHGAGGRGESILPAFTALAELTGTLLIAPNSEDTSWDVIRGGYGPDVRAIDEILDGVFARFAIDPQRLAIGGFSDGASYALSLGVINGSLFSHVLAFAPGFMVPTYTRDSPRIFITHGTEDRVLPIDNCSRRIVPRLNQAGYEVIYREFAGGHVIPLPLAEEAFHWLVGS